MELIITPNMEDCKDTEIKYLKFKNRQLEEKNKFLIAMLAEVLGNRTIVIREEALEETLEHEPRFKVEENLGGDMILSVKKWR